VLGKIVRQLFVLGVVAAFILLVAGFMNSVHPAFDTIAHFRLHLSLGIIIVLPFLLKLKFRRFGIVCATVGVFGFWSAASGLPFITSTQTAEKEKATYQAFHLNLLWNNREKQRVIDRILQIDAEIVTLSEVSDSWSPFLAQIRNKWTYTAHCPEWSVRGGIMIFSKWPLDPTIEHCGDYGSLLIANAEAPDGSRITLAATHPRWPWPASGPRQFAAMVPALERTGPDMLVAGDFNATTWSHSIRQFASAGNLEVYRGIGATWLYGPLFPKPVIRLFGLPIDNVMSKGKIRILSVKTLELMGSDHLPLLIRFQII